MENIPDQECFLICKEEYIVTTPKLLNRYYTDCKSALSSYKSFNLFYKNLIYT